MKKNKRFFVNMVKGSVYMVGICTIIKFILSEIKIRINSDKNVAEGNGQLYSENSCNGPEKAQGLSTIAKESN